jgi:hypothetical protein
VALLIAEKDRSSVQKIRRDDADYQSLGFIQDLDQDLVRQRDIRPSMVVAKSYPQAAVCLGDNAVIGKVEAQGPREDRDLEV